MTDFKKRGEFPGTENKRGENEDQFISVLNNSPDIIYRFNLQTGHYEFISPAIRSLGYKPEEVMAMSKEEVLSRVHQDDRSSLVSFLLNINDAGEGLKEYRFQGNDGKYRWLSNKIVIIKDSQGKLLYHDGFVRDITQDKLSQERLKESEVRFRSLYETNFDATLITLPDGSILSANPAAQKMFGMTREEIIKAGREGLVVKDENLKQALKNRAQKGHVNAVLTLKRKNGSIFTGEMTSSYFTDADGTVKTSMIIRDLTEQKKAEKELIESEERYHSLFKNNHATMLLINPENGDIMDVNPAAASFYGYSEEKLKEMKITDINIFTDRQVFEKMQKAKKKEKNHFLFKHRLASGEIRCVDTYSGPITVNGKKLLYSIIHDVTHRRKAEEALKESEDRFSKAFNFSPVGMTITRLADGCYIDVNETWTDLYEYSRSEVIGHTFLELNVVELDERTKFLEILKEKSVVNNYEIPTKTKTGKPLTILISMNIINLNSQDHILTTFIDVTEQKKTEKHKQELLEKEKQLREDLETSNQELQNTSEELYTSNKELRQIQRELKETIKKLEISNKELEQFAYVASHDLQEPLRMVASFTQLLERKYKGHIDADADDYIGFIVEGSNRMKDLIDDLLAFSRLNTGTKEFKQTNLANLLDDVLLSMHTSIEENNAIITYDPLPTIKCDHSQIRQLLQNLITNAIKFHDKEPPKIHISAEETGNEWKFRVQDNGIGIGPEYREKIFDVFNRLHSREEYEGTGIGLSIAKRIINHHKGRIWVESESGKGSTFYFTIPKDL